MDEEFDTSVDTSDVDTSDIDTSDVVVDVPDDIPEDIPDDIPEDIPDDEPESIDEDFSEDIPEDVPDDEPESIDEDLSEEIPEDVADDESESVEDDLSEDIPEDVPEDESELTEDDLTEDIPEEQDEDTSDNDEAATEDVAEETAFEAEDTDSTEQTEDTQDEQTDETVTDEAVEETAFEAEDTDSTEVAEDTQDEQLTDTATDDVAKETASETEDTDSTEQTEDTQDEQPDGVASDEAVEETSLDIGEADAAEPIEDNQDDPPKVLKRNEFDLLRSGNDAINQRLEVQADDYRDKGFSEEEIRDRLAADRWNFQKEFLEDAFPGQDVSPNVFNGFSENGARDRISDIEQSATLRNQLNTSDISEEPVVDMDHTNFAEQINNAQDKSSGDVAITEATQVASPAEETTFNEQVENAQDEPAVDLITDENAADSDGTNWERTSLRPEEETLLQEMEANGEIEFPQENPDLEDPVHTELHLPTENTGEFLGEKGNSEFKPISEEALSRMTQYGRDTVEYNDGYPDFSPFTSHDSEWGKINGQVEIGHMTDNRENPTWEFGKRPRGSGHDPHYNLGNFSQADNAIAEQLKGEYPQIKGEDIEKYRKENHLIWHECADGKTMQLVPEEIHAACRHSGGVSEMKYRMAWGDVTRKIN